MNGPEHYEEAQRLLNLARLRMDMAGEHTREEAAQDARDYVAEAQVHATLAQVAVIANAGQEKALVDAPDAWDKNPRGDGVTWQAVLR